MLPIRAVLVLLAVPAFVALPPWGGLPLSAASLREPVHPRRNVEQFPPVPAKYIRFTIRATNRGEPCLDELEVYAEGEERNLALAAHGARATASGSLPGYQIHDLAGINDGRYGNGRSWIADRTEGAWVQIELPEAHRVHKVIWGRDREGNFIDRLSTAYQIEVALTTNAWRQVASSDDREPLGVGAQLLDVPSLTRPFVNRFAPVATTFPTEGDGGVSPEYRIDVWQTSDGLPGNTVTAIEQTPDGYLWIGTLNGLVRFDGFRFQVLGESSALPNTKVLCLLVDPRGTLWIGTDGGGLVALRSGQFKAWTKRDGLNSDSILSLADAGAGRIWVGTAAGLNAWHDGKIEGEPPMEMGGQGRTVPSLHQDQSGALWVISGNELLVRTNAEPLSRPTAKDPSAFSTVFSIGAGRDGATTWFGGANGYVGAIRQGVVTVHNEQPGQLLGAIWVLHETRQGDLWVGTAGGGLRRLRQGRFTSITTQEGLSDNSVRCLFEDRERNLWVGTMGGGLNRLKARRLTTFTTRDGLAHNVVMSIAEDATGSLWAGSNCGGLSARRNGRFAPFHANYLLDNECIWSVCPTRDGSLWLGTWGGGLFRMRGKEVRNFSIARMGVDDPVIAICEDEADGLWIGTAQSGARRFRGEQVVQNLATNGLPLVGVTSFVREPDGPLWIGTSGSGVFRFDGRTCAPLTRSNGLPGNFVRTLYRDTKGALWIGTSSGLGLWHDGRISGFGRAHGLPDEVISQILEDQRGNLWFGCNQGIFRVAREEFTAVTAGRAVRVNAIVYGRADGMESIECTGAFHPAGLRARDGQLWFSTVKGLVAVDPVHLPVNDLAPPVHVEEVHVDGAPIPLEFSAITPRIEPGAQRIEFHFTAPSLVAPERNRFKYRLDPLEKNWVEAGSQRSAVYSHLPPGSFTFRVTACNNDGIWNETGAELRFVVIPHLWQSWWFRIGGGALILVGGGWIVRALSVRRLRRKLERLTEQHAVEKERARIAQDIHDELGASLTRITLLTEVGQKHDNVPPGLAADLGRISTTAREAVRAMDAIVWAVNPRNDSLDHFANYISQFAEELFQLTPIRCRLDVPAHLPECPLSTEARHHLFLAVKEALNNVVRHSGASEVWLRLGMDNGNLKISVDDNGQGIRAPARPGSDHNGLGNIRRRMEVLGGRFELSSQPAAGTSLILRLPLPGSRRALNPPT